MIGHGCEAMGTDNRDRDVPPRIGRAEQIATKPPLESLDALIIADLTDTEYNAFLDALGS